MELVVEVELVAWLKMRSGTCGRDVRNKATPRGPAMAPNEEGPPEEWSVAVVVVAVESDSR